MAFLIFNMLWTAIIAFTVVLLFIKIKKRINYFSERNLVFMKPNWIDQINALSVKQIFESPSEIYNKYKDGNKPYIGYFSTLLKPQILLLHTDLVERILIKDFSYFHDRGFEIDTDRDPLLGHLFTMKGDRWRTLRHKLTPTFTSAKLRGMVPIMEECANSLIESMKQDNTLLNNVDLKKLFSVYTLAVIAICAFGIDPKGLQDPDCEFKRNLKEMLKPGFISLLKGFFMFNLPFLTKLFSIKFTSKDMDDFFLKLAKDSFEMRSKSGIKRNDFIQLLLELKEKGSVQLEAKDLEEDERKYLENANDDKFETKLEFTDELLTAQIFIFLVAGFDNTSYLSGITVYEVAKHPEIQKRLREEVKEVKEKHGAITYEALRDMKLLGACLDEALRLYPPVQTLQRICNKTYPLKEGGHFDNGLNIVIPVTNIHRNDKYWPDPNEFKPDRFLSGEPIHPGTYIPFGDGPRICIAQRVALIISKLVVAKLLETHEFLPCAKNKEPLKLATFEGASIIGGIWGNFKEIKHE